jgi:hypothetical protein
MEGLLKAESAAREVPVMAKPPRSKKVTEKKMTLGRKWQLYRQRRKVERALDRYDKITGNEGFLTAVGTLGIRVRRADGSLEDHGTVGVRSVTNAGVAFMVDDWDDDTTDITTLKWHDSGDGPSAENVTDTALATATGEARDSGTMSQPAANQIRSVTTHTYAGGFTIREHGVFSANAAGTLWDRTVFSGISVAASDQIEFTYTLTITAGG